LTTEVGIVVIEGLRCKWSNMHAHLPANPCEMLGSDVDTLIKQGVVKMS
jgi:hypothetical protein